MAVLNPPRSLPGIARAVAFYLARQPKQSDSKRRIEQLFAPPTLSPDRAGRETPGSQGLNDTLAVSRSIGLLGKGTETITLSTETKTWFKGNNVNEEDFRRFLRRLLLNSARDSDPWIFNEDGQASSTGARDFARGATWLLAQDAFGPSLAWNGLSADEEVEDRQRKTLPEGVPRAFENDTRWRPFTRWAPFVGLARAATRGDRTYLAPDATRAIASELPPLLGKRPEPLEVVLAKLGALLPVLPGGAFRDALDSRLREGLDPATRKGALDSTISQALLVLNEEKIITVEYLSDSEGVMTVLDEQGQHHRLSHIRLGAD